MHAEGILRRDIAMDASFWIKELADRYRCVSYSFDILHAAPSQLLSQIKHVVV